MVIKTTQELAQAVNEAIKESGIKKVFIAEKLGIKREVFARMLNKKQFSLDDANRILDILDMQTETNVIKKDTKT